jgi:hypothetical protein
MVALWQIQLIFWQNDSVLHDEKPIYHPWFYDNVEESLEERAEMAILSALKPIKTH